MSFRSLLPLSQKWIPRWCKMTDDSWAETLQLLQETFRSRVEAGLAWRFLGGTRWHAWMDAFFDSGRNELHRNWKKVRLLIVYERCLISRRMIWKSWKQFGVKNIATTGHQLQGMSKDQLVVSSWNYSSKNWIYVVLSRVTCRTLSGLYLFVPTSRWDETVPNRRQKLLVEESRLARMEEEKRHSH